MPLFQHNSSRKCTISSVFTAPFIVAVTVAIIATTLTAVVGASNSTIDMMIAQCFGGIEFNAPYKNWINSIYGITDNETTGSASIAPRATPIRYTRALCLPSKGGSTAVTTTGTSESDAAPDNTTTNSNPNLHRNGIAIHWTMDNDNIYLGLVVRATGWFGFGLGETGGMRGSDMLLYETEYPYQIRDAHVLDYLHPIDDLCQDWVLLNTPIILEDDGFIMVEVMRKLNTSDSQDHVIFNDSNTSIPSQVIVAAWGDTPSIWKHTDKYHVSQGYIRWYSSDTKTDSRSDTSDLPLYEDVQDGNDLDLIASQLKERSMGYFDLFVPNHTISSTLLNSYLKFCYTWEDVLAFRTTEDTVDQLSSVPPNTTIYMIGTEFIPSATALPYLHHMTAAGSTEAINGNGTCGNETYGYTIIGWAVGSLPFVLPDNVAYTFGPSTTDTTSRNVQAFKIETHYFNPQFHANVVDSSKLRIYYTTTPQAQEASLMGLGDVIGNLRPSAIPENGVTEYSFTCRADCSLLALNDYTNPNAVPFVTVHQELYHMHVHGVSTVTYQLRNNEIIRRGQINFFDFQQNGVPSVRQAPFHIYAGDSFVTKFYVRTHPNETITFGKDSAQEMLEAIFIYYPAKNLFNGRSPWGCVYDVPLNACNASLSIIESSLSPASTSDGRDSASDSLDPTSITPTITIDENGNLIIPDRSFGQTPSQCSMKATLSNNMNNKTGTSSSLSYFTTSTVSGVFSLLAMAVMTLSIILW